MSESTTTTTPVKTPKPKKEPKQPVLCWCGCGGLTKNRFVPGHDARFHGWAKKVARGEMNEAETLAQLPHDEARVLFLEHVVKERPLAAARQAEKDQKEAEKLRKKAEKEEAKKAQPQPEGKTETEPSELIAA